MQLKLLSWNIQQGGGSRLPQIVKAILETQAAIVHLSEYKNNQKGEQLRSALLKAGYRFQFVTAADPQENSVLVASRLPLSVAYCDWDIDHRHKVLLVSSAAFSICAVYLPHKKKHKLFDFILDHLTHANLPLILCGDLNTGKNFIDQKGDSFWYTDKLLELESHDMLDVFRHIRGDVKEYSWFSHQGNGFRYDHIYVHKSLLPVIRDCSYVHQWREQKYSDHSAMLLTLGR